MTKLKKGVLVGTIPKVKREWDLSFDVKPMDGTRRRASLVRVTTTDNDKGKLGDRIPAVFINRRLMIFVCSLKDSSKNSCIRSQVKLPKGKYSNVLVQQRKKNGRYVFSLTINGKAQVKRGIMKKNFVPPEYNNAKVWAADKFRDTANAYMKNLVFSNYGECHSLFQPCNDVALRQHFKTSVIMSSYLDGSFNFMLLVSR